MRTGPPGYSRALLLTGLQPVPRGGGHRLREAPATQLSQLGFPPRPCVSAVNLAKPQLTLSFFAGLLSLSCALLMHSHYSLERILRWGHGCSSASNSGQPRATLCPCTCRFLLHPPLSSNPATPSQAPGPLYAMFTHAHARLGPAQVQVFSAPSSVSSMRMGLLQVHPVP